LLLKFIFQTDFVLVYVNCLADASISSSSIHEHGRDRHRHHHQYHSPRRRRTSSTGSEDGSDNTPVYTFSTTTTTARAATTLYTSIKSNTKTNRYLNASASANIHQNLQQQHRHHNQRRRQLLGFHGGAATLGGALHGGLGSEGMMVARRPVCSISGSPRAGPPLEMVRARVDTKKSCCNPLVCMFETSFVVQFPWHLTWTSITCYIVIEGKSCGTYGKVARKCLEGKLASWNRFHWRQQ